MYRSRSDVIVSTAVLPLELLLESGVPNFVVLDGEIVIDAVGADGPGGIESQNIFGVVNRLRLDWSTVFTRKNGSFSARF